MTVTSSSIKSGAPVKLTEYCGCPVSAPGIYSGIFVCVTKSTDPVLNFSIFIFFGSVWLSVQNNKPSIMFIPVIKYDGLKLSIPAVSTSIGLTALPF